MDFGDRLCAEPIAGTIEIEALAGGSGSQIGGKARGKGLIDGVGAHEKYQENNARWERVFFSDFFQLFPRVHVGGGERSLALLRLLSSL